ncbi:glutamine synthetase family protein [Nitrococcus mobilis]|uniref:Putative glutamine synthetase n=1 Tax=Nitrococcus mobilis Nb-231 TaxID=314278 RepID=A4BN69_9GAMM|nr:glutamine synthetase family protein [Nitrococcus mobilis]EAR22668.1 putative glutamine synthetase [Nitrococcus mobilis Nb-231]
MPDRAHRGRLPLDELRAGVAAGTLHTVMLAMVDMQGRLQGKRLTAEHFLDEVVERKAEGCCYQLAVDVEMNTVPGYRHASWSTGYGDFVFAPDLTTLRRIPWHAGTALVMSDLEWADGAPVVVSPRQILRRQIERLAERGLIAFAGTELEFIVFRESYEEAWRKGYRELTPANFYNVDYALLDTARLEPLLARIRNGMQGAGLPVEDSKGECNLGQHEINFRYRPALETADGHAIYKTGAKEIAAQEGYALTFMAKFNEREGNSCHIHLSVRSADDTPVMAEGHALSALGAHFVAGLLAGLRELTLFFAPNINSYKRYVAGSFAPTAVAWGRDNRTCALRLVGHGPSLRIENRVPGGDVNPYLALAAMIAAGIHGMDHKLTLESAFTGNAYQADKPWVPHTLGQARELFAGCELALEAFGAEVVEHYLHMAQVELEAFEAAVTDWERYRGFERL